MRLVNYKGFENHLISFRHTNVLVGANNAGKSTALGALRLVVAMIPTARRTAPSDVGEREGRPTRGWPITQAAMESSAFARENVRHDFRPLESRIEVTTNNGTKLVASWAEERDDEEVAQRGMFFVVPPDGSGLKPRTAAQELTPQVAMVPTLTPLDDREKVVTLATLKPQLTSRRASRLFRNALAQLTGDEWVDFTSYVYERTPELGKLTLHRSLEELDLYFEEESTRHEREIGWAGDGVQIWVQALFHLWRQRGSDVVILDEPDVFLHPDLQRRLARTLFEQDAQVIVATHSIEILAEAEPGSALWVDRARRTSERPRSDGSLALVGRRLGSGYELGVGRALRSRTVLFVEGDDAPILARLAKRLGHSSVASSENYATVPLGGFSKKWRAGAFAETMSALGGSVNTFVLLDSDLRSPGAIEAEVAEVRRAGSRVHVWHRRELENYLLVPRAIARVSGIREERAAEILDAVLDELAVEANRAFLAQRLDERGQKVGDNLKLANKSFLSLCAQEFDERWATFEGKVSVVDAKAAIRALNARLQKLNVKTLNAHSLASAMHPDYLAEEVARVMSELEELVRNP